MKNHKIGDDILTAGNHLHRFIKIASFGGLFISLFGTGIILVGSEEFRSPAIIWKISITLNGFSFFLSWATYYQFKNTDQLIGHGLLSLFILFSFFWLFGFAGFYFYFLFAPINIWMRTIILCWVTGLLLYRAYAISFDIALVFQKNNKLFHQIYCEEEDRFTYSRNAFSILQKARPDRSPFRSVHAYAAIITIPFIIILNRLLSPVFGSGHGVFLVLAFFSAPILLWGVDLFVQSVITTIYYPIKLKQETGKPVLLKDW